jgi:uncharacterized protein YuzB (UPF0349 family)
MVDREALVVDLENFGNVVFCDQNTDISYLVVMSDWTENEATFEAIANIYIVTDFPQMFVLTLVDGVLKAQFNK